MSGMGMQSSIAKNKSKNFALRIIKLSNDGRKTGNMYCPSKFCVQEQVLVQI